MGHGYHEEKVQGDDLGSSEGPDKLQATIDERRLKGVSIWLLVRGPTREALGRLNGLVFCFAFPVFSVLTVVSP